MAAIRVPRLGPGRPRPRPEIVHADKAYSSWALEVLDGIPEDDDVEAMIVSFGYSHSPAPGADLTIDARRHFRNPHHDPRMRELTGLDRPARAAVVIPDSAAAVRRMAWISVSPQPASPCRGIFGAGSLRWVRGRGWGAGHVGVAGGGVVEEVGVDRDCKNNNGVTPDHGGHT
ncbi:RapZ C-terminal domain-containing protein [Nonomuraea candida]|uniref:RapZ C-terminal domain-containing protein n=1 Tax=Nonomuraea candida TaxID=359159 RepID=UPI0006950338